MMRIPDLMMNSMDGVFGIDSEQKILFWNSASESITGIKASDAIGRSCHQLMKGRDPAGRPVCRPDCPVGALARGGPPPSQMCMRIDHTDGQTIQLSVGTMLIPSTIGQAWDVVHVMRRGRERRQQLWNTSEDTGAPDATPLLSVAGAECGTGASTLTARELEVLRLLASGQGIGGMSDRLHISVATVRNHLQRLMSKLDVHSRVEAVAYAHRHQLI